MRIRSDFIKTMLDALEHGAINDNTAGDKDFVLRNIATSELTYTLAVLELEHRQLP